MRIRLLTVLWLAGCARISDADVAAKVNQVEQAPPADTDACEDCTPPEVTDADGDGVTLDDDPPDCDDTDAGVYPGAPDAWYDGVDANCDGADDDDQDGDGAAWVGRGGTDCDDLDAAIGPDATEVWYDNVDQDCSGGSDYDQDGDGQDRLADGGTDCDDTDASVFLGQLEACDGRDNDCDGLVDLDDRDDLTWYFDNDGDGFGNSDQFVVSCSPINGAAQQPGDCDDSRSNVHPGAVEGCDGLDNDCDDLVDDDDVADITGQPTWYFDGDGDGFALTGAPTKVTCDQPAGYAAQDGDCDDGDATEFPGQVWYVDSDGDGWGAGSVTNDVDCDRPTGFGPLGDCDDNDNSVHPDMVLVVPTDHATVQQAVDAVCEGGTVQLLAQVHTGTFDTSNKAVHIVGAGESTTTIDADGGSLDVGGWLSDLTIINARHALRPREELEVARVTITGAERGLRATGLADVVSLTEVTIEGSTNIGLEVVSGAHLTLVDSVVAQNDDRGMSTWGGSTTVDSTGTLWLENNEYIASGGAIWAESGTQVWIDGDRFEANTAATGGGAVSVATDAVVEAVDTAFVANLADRSAGVDVACEKVGAATFTGSYLLFAANQAATGEGGGLGVCDQGVATISRSTFAGNEASNGGAVWAEGAHTTSLSRVILLGNVGKALGVPTSGVPIGVSTSVFFGNDDGRVSHMDDPIGTSGNSRTDPKVISFSALPWDTWDLHLHPSSALSDMGAYPDDAEYYLDLDANGLPDGWEARYGLLSGPTGDDDNDSFTNQQEIDAGTDPTNPDTDGDTLLDGEDPTPLSDVTL